MYLYQISKQIVDDYKDLFKLWYCGCYQCYVIRTVFGKNYLIILLNSTKGH